MKKFVKASELKLGNGGYLLTGKENTPVCNTEFVEAQQSAEWLITMVNLSKGKDFEGKPAYTMAELEAATKEAMAEKDIAFVELPTAPKEGLAAKLAKEALGFINHSKDTNKTIEINAYLQSYKVIHEFEEFGLFFKEKIVKLNKIYTMAEITEAATTLLKLTK